MENHLKLMSTTSIKKPFAMKYGIKLEIRKINKNSRIRRRDKSVLTATLTREKCRRTWKKASCFTFDQKNGCFNAVLAFGLRYDENSSINVPLTMCEKLLVKMVRHAYIVMTSISTVELWLLISFKKVT